MFENVLRLADSASAPMEFWLRFEFEGALDREVWSTAVRASLRRHPLLTATIRADSRQVWMWQAGEPRETQVCWGESLSHVMKPIDLTHEPGVRLWMRSGAERTWMDVQVHHVSSDALGILQFVGDLRECYRAMVDVRPDGLRKLESGRLVRREEFGLTRWGWLLRFPQDSLGLLGMYEYLLHDPPRIGLKSPREHSPRPCQDELFATAVELSAQETSELKNRARVHGATLNDLLLTALFSALAEFTPRRGLEPIRISLAMNLRVAEDRATPAANLAGVLFLDRRPARFASPVRLLKSVHIEMWLCKRWKAGLTMMRLLSWMSLAQRGRLTLPSDMQTLSTAVLSNLGVPWDALGWSTTSHEDERVKLLSAAFLPPVMPHCSLAFGAVTCQGRLNLTMNYDRCRITTDEARQLMEAFHQRLREWLADSP